MGNQTSALLPCPHKEKATSDLTQTDLINSDLNTLLFETNLLLKNNDIYRDGKCCFDFLPTKILKTRKQGRTEDEVEVAVPFKETKSSNNVINKSFVKTQSKCEFQPLEGKNERKNESPSKIEMTKADTEGRTKPTRMGTNFQRDKISRPTPTKISKSNLLRFKTLIEKTAHTTGIVTKRLKPNFKVSDVNLSKNTSKMEEETKTKLFEQKKVEFKKTEIKSCVHQYDKKNFVTSNSAPNGNLSFESHRDSNSNSTGSFSGNTKLEERDKKIQRGGRDGVEEDIPQKNIRNFSIIAHIDHGKSTLADRLLEMTGAVMASSANKQVLDKLQVEKERGITVKAQTASLFYQYKGEKYLLNLIDTPGHVDFSNEVSRSLAACQGVILLVDANQGVQAQTVANFYLAFEKELTILPVLNKIDLPNSNPEQVKEQLFNMFTIDPEDVLMISAKTGMGVEKVLEALILRVPYPSGNRSAPLRALIFDSWFDKFRGTMALAYIRDGIIKLGDEISSVYTKQNYTVRGLGMLRPEEEETNKLLAGQVGFLVCNMRSVSEAHIGDTLHLKGKDIEPLEEFTPARPMVFAGLYPVEKSDLQTLKNALEKLSLNDPSVTVVPDSSPILGQGWRVGFLGLLHLEVFNQRLEQEYGAEAVMTAPSVPYKVKVKGKKLINQFGGEEILISDPSKLPETVNIEEISEPKIIGTIITPAEYVSKVICECIDRRGVQISTTNIDSSRLLLKFELPLNEVIVDFHDNIKSLTSGYASFDYEDHGYAPSDLVKLDIIINGDVIDSLSTIVHSSKSLPMGKRMCAKLAEIIPRQQVPIIIQAAVRGKIHSRETIKPFRKDVTAKLYGGDVTRKMKLLQKQAAGKKKMKQIANINIPKEAFIDYLKR